MTANADGDCNPPCPEDSAQLARHVSAFTAGFCEGEVVRFSRGPQPAN